MEEELPLPVYDPSLQPAYVLALEDTREYVLNKVERRISAVERIDSLTEELRRDRLAARGRHLQIPEQQGQRHLEEEHGEHNHVYSGDAHSYYAAPPRRARYDQRGATWAPPSPPRDGLAARGRHRQLPIQQDHHCCKGDEISEFMFVGSR